MLMYWRPNISDTYVICVCNRVCVCTVKIEMSIWVRTIYITTKIHMSNVCVCVRQVLVFRMVLCSSIQIYDSQYGFQANWIGAFYARINSMLLCFRNSYQILSMLLLVWGMEWRSFFPSTLSFCWRTCWTSGPCVFFVPISGRWRWCWRKLGAEGTVLLRLTRGVISVVDILIMCQTN